MDEKEFDELYIKLKKQCLSNVLNRVTEECMDEETDEVDITKLKKELNSFRQREIDEPGSKKKTEGNLTYYLLIRKLENFAAEHLKKYVMSIDKDTISTSAFSKSVKNIDIDTPLPNMAPDLPTKVVVTKEKDNAGKKDAIQLTTGDSIKKRFQTTLILKTAKDGTLYEARSRICYKLTTDNHYVAIGKFDNDYKKQKLTEEDIAQVKADGYPYINQFGKEENNVDGEEEKEEEETNKKDAEEEEDTKKTKKKAVDTNSKKKKKADKEEGTNSKKNKKVDKEEDKEEEVENVKNVKKTKKKVDKKEEEIDEEKPKKNTKGKKKSKKVDQEEEDE